MGASGTLETYLREINRAPLLTPAEELELAGRVLEGDAEARELMIRSNLRLVVSIARNYAGRGLPLLDLIEEGNLGLMKAVERFDPEAECRFSTYATWWIKQAVRRSLVNNVRTVRIPSYLVELISRWRAAEQRLRQDRGRDPSHAEICEELAIEDENSRQVRRALAASQLTTQPLSFDDEESLADIIEDENSPLPEDELFNAAEIARLRKLLEEVDEREGVILRHRFGLDGAMPLTLREIGERLGITRERVRQIQNETLQRLHAVLASGRGETV